MKAATIYERKGKLFVHSSSKTVAGLWVISRPVLATEKDDIALLGRSVKECLAASHECIPHPASFKNLFDPVLALAGVKSFRTFIKSAKCVEVEASDSAILILIPTRNEGAENGFVHLPDRTEATLSSDEALGSAVVATLAIAE